MFFLEILPVHEVENLVPLNYIDKLDWNENNRYKKAGLDYLRDNAHTESIIKYFDFKKVSIIRILGMITSFVVMRRDVSV